jgi:hypothetical protein
MSNLGDCNCIISLPDAPKTSIKFNIDVQTGYNAIIKEVGAANGYYPLENLATESIEVQPGQTYQQIQQINALCINTDTPIILTLTTTSTTITLNIKQTIILDDEYQSFKIENTGTTIAKVALYYGWNNPTITPSSQLEWVNQPTYIANQDYINTTGSPILVYISASSTVPNSMRTINVDGLPVCRVNGVPGASNQVSFPNGLRAVVPPGSTYRLSTSDDITISQWKEFRSTVGTITGNSNPGWQQITNKLPNTPYVNTSSNPLIVSINGKGNRDFVVIGLQVNNEQVCSQTVVPAGNWANTLGVVPPGATWFFEVTGASWFEADEWFEYEDVNNTFQVNAQSTYQDLTNTKHYFQQYTNDTGKIKSITGAVRFSIHDTITFGLIEVLVDGKVIDRGYTTSDRIWLTWNGVVPAGSTYQVNWQGDNMDSQTQWIELINN